MTASSSTCAALFVIALSSSLACPSGESQPPESPAATCTSAGYTHFDFWVGNWEVRTAQGQLAGTNRIEKAHGGCALLEHWSSASGGSGTSTNQWQPSTQQWTQHWVDASGAAIDLVGRLEGGAMILVGTYLQPDGTSQQMRGTWTPMDDGRVRQFFETSEDGGSWTPWFEGFYARAK